jgi:hypothetical protein
MAFVLTNARDRRLLAAVALFLLTAGTSSSLAQKTPKLPSGTGGGAGGVGGGAGNVDTVPDFRPVPMAPAAPSTAAPQPVAPAPAPIIRFRCQVAPGASTCKEQPAPDGGGESDTCDCARDLCYNDDAGARICEKP